MARGWRAGLGLRQVSMNEMGTERSLMLKVMKKGKQTLMNLERKEERKRKEEEISLSHLLPCVTSLFTPFYQWI